MIAFEAASATITVDGDASDWSAIEGATVNLEQIRLENLDPSQAAEIKFGPLDPVDVTFKVANDGKNVYVLLEVPGDFDYNPADHNLSASVAVMFRVDEPAAPHMGAEEPDTRQEPRHRRHLALGARLRPRRRVGRQGYRRRRRSRLQSRRRVLHHPGEPRGRRRGRRRERRRRERPDRSLGAHRASVRRRRGRHAGSSRSPGRSQTGDPQDGQFASGGTAYVALAFFDPNEGPDGWSDAGHLQSAYSGWIEVTLK